MKRPPLDVTNKAQVPKGKSSATENTGSTRQDADMGSKAGDPGGWT